MKTRPPASKIIPAENLAVWREQMRREGRSVVCTNGVFDLLHHGHVQYLADAAALGDVLLLCINDDAGVSALKGPNRPLNTAMDRAFLLAGLESVDAVTIFSGERATDILRIAAPDIYVKGGDYTEETIYQPEREVLKAAGAQIKFIPFVSGFSTTNLVQKMAGDDTGKAMFDVMFHRRSIRKFKNQPVSDEQIYAILKAGMAAPSACATYPWHFIVVKDAAQKEAVSQCMRNGHFFKDAAAGIIVCGDLKQACGGELSYMIQDCSAAIENMLLAATAQQLGGCWIGIHPRMERVAAISKTCALPESVLPIAAIALGYPDESPLPNSRYVEKAVHADRF